MKKPKFTEAQIVFSINQSEQGVKVEEIATRWVSAKQPSTTGKKVWGIGCF